MEYFLYKGHFYRDEGCVGSTGFIVTNLTSGKVGEAMKAFVEKNEFYSGCSVKVERRGTITIEDTDLFVDKDSKGKIKVWTAPLDLWK
jgi:hypothetical protein|tara:strand:- start:7173 stop:7436 length:264 start_codon:yes stop_codon:yes gene_type:complete